MRRELTTALAMAQTLPPEELPRLLGDLREIEATAQSRLASPVVTPTEDRLLDVSECAARLHCSTDFLYRNAAKLPFTRANHVGGKLLFSSSALDAYLRAKR